MDLSTKLVSQLLGYRFHTQHRRGSLNIVRYTLSRANSEDMSAIDMRCLSAIYSESVFFVDLQSDHFKSAEHRSGPGFLFYENMDC